MQRTYPQLGVYISLAVSTVQQTYPQPGAHISLAVCSVTYLSTSSSLNLFNCFQNNVLTQKREFRSLQMFSVQRTHPQAEASVSSEVCSKTYSPKRRSFSLFRSLQQNVLTQKKELQSLQMFAAKRTHPKEGASVSSDLLCGTCSGASSAACPGSVQSWLAPRSHSTESQLAPPHSCRNMTSLVRAFPPASRPARLTRARTRAQEERVDGGCLCGQ